MAKALAIIEASIAKLVGIEKESKALIAECAVDCLDSLHDNGQTAVCNKLLLALSPANKKVVFAFFREYSGFIMDKEEGMKKKKQPVRAKDGTIEKDAYADARISYNEFKEQGSSLWLWYAAWGKQDKPVATPLDLNKVSKTVQGFAEKADKQGIKRIALFNAIIGGVFEAQEVADMLKALALPVKIGEKAAAPRKEEEPALV